MGMALWAIERQRKVDALNEGLAAFVKLYYDNFTDATEVEADAIRALTNLADILDLADVDVQDIIRSAESDLNATGGVRSDTDGTVHKVHTAWADEDEDD